ncbi:hypothetical protein GN156_33705, partial [bacterium LRH843]|nr:hypothetical protein [bacterium LRH843]
TTFLPLSNHIADIESRVLEGEVVIERLRVAMEDDRLHMTSKESHQIIREASIGIHEEFAGARSILDSLNLDDLSKDAAIATTKVS